MSAVLSKHRALRLGFAADKRRRRREHRRAAKNLIDGGVFLNALAPVGSTPWHVAQWHLRQARWL